MQIDICLADTYTESAESYTSAMALCLNNLAQVTELINSVKKIKTDEDFLRAQPIYELVSSLYCAAFNTDNPQFDQVAEILGTLTRPMYQHCKRRVKENSSATKAVVKYVLARPRRMAYKNEEKMRTIAFLVKKGLLFKRVEGEKTQALVVGLHLPCNDNVYRVDRNGREYPLTFRHIIPQAYSIAPEYDEILDERKDSLPELPEIYTWIGINGGKGSGKMSIPKSEWRMISNILFP